ncbi:VOC family protein [Proteiniclasticum ruminis]|uniref:Lactoylglutathione lyase n=1 Tax=Proteiniclasticum ruminis TaxID=398199 RepID=A0A1I4ZXJ2_9CLOT|nr:VOC family protein [Proteiniclasticum ruminis]SFN54907.1 lactoylglutathione lyase [Proteiniclasticum ruminis]
MKIEHAALYTEDLERMRSFFMKYFEASSNELYHNPKTGFTSYFLSFQEGARLEIMNKPQMEKTGDALLRTGFIHLAFSVGSKEKVDVLTETLRKGGYEVLSGPRITGDGYYESLILGPERIQIEITE